jgi:uncharacterized membrane protein
LFSGAKPSTTGIAYGVELVDFVSEAYLHVIARWRKVALPFSPVQCVVCNVAGLRDAYSKAMAPVWEDLGPGGATDEVCVRKYSSVT